MWTRTLLVGAMAIGTVALSSVDVQSATTAVAHAAGCDTWYGPGGGPSSATSGLWGAGTNWSTGVIPSSPDDVCINLPGTYTVTLAPCSLGTAVLATVKKGRLRSCSTCRGGRRTTPISPKRFTLTSSSTPAQR
jgi:hypothetical protein